MNFYYIYLHHCAFIPLNNSIAHFYIKVIYRLQSNSYQSTFKKHPSKYWWFICEMVYKIENTFCKILFGNNYTEINF